ALLVGVSERVHDVAQEPHGVYHRQLALPRQLGAERLALDEGHGVVEQVAGPAGREERDDMRMLQPGRELDLAAEALHVDPRGQVGREDLDHHLAPERALLREIDPAHPAATQLAQEAVAVTQGILEVVEQGRHQIASASSRPRSSSMPSAQRDARSISPSTDWSQRAGPKIRGPGMPGPSGPLHGPLGWDPRAG